MHPCTHSPGPSTLLFFRNTNTGIPEPVLWERVGDQVLTAPMTFPSRVNLKELLSGSQDTIDWPLAEGNR